MSASDNNVAEDVSTSSSKHQTPEGFKFSFEDYCGTEGKDYKGQTLVPIPSLS